MKNIPDTNLPQDVLSDARKESVYHYLIQEDEQYQQLLRGTRKAHDSLLLALSESAKLLLESFLDCITDENDYVHSAFYEQGLWDGLKLGSCETSISGKKY